ncbi:MAG: hypothetical protein ACKVZJ_12945 [Phycisphaerales bacterium]
MNRLIAFLAATFLLAPAASAQDDNPIAVNLVRQFSSLKQYPEALGFNLNQHFPLSYFTGWLSDGHVQGIARSLRPGNPCIYVTVAGKSDASAPFGYITTVLMGSRDVLGERFRSNRIGYEADGVTNYSTRFTFPPFNDAPVARFTFDGTQGPVDPVLWKWRHPGNIAVIGDAMLVPLEDKLSGNYFSSSSAFAIFDVADPTNPAPVSIIPLNDPKAGTLAVTRLDNGRYLVLIGGVNSGQTLVGYLSSTTNLRDPAITFTQAFRWNQSTNNFGNSDYDWPWDNEGDPLCTDGTDAHQHYAFVRNDDGKLYLIATTKRRSCGSPFYLGRDEAELFEVVMTGSPVNFMQLILRGAESFVFNEDTSGYKANFTAAGGVHISPSGSLLLYAAPHSWGNEPRFNGSSVEQQPPNYMQFVEIRPWFVNAISNPGPGTAHVELYEDQDFEGRSIILDFQDRFEESWSSFLGNIDDFNDKTHSVSYCIPAGLTVSGRTDANGFGTNVSLFSFNVFAGAADLGSLGDELSSLAWSGSLATEVWVSNSRAIIGQQSGTFAKPTLGINGGLSQCVGPVNKIFVEPGFYNEKVTFVKPMQIIASPGVVVIGAPN